MDDHAFIRGAIRALVEADPGFVVCGEAESGDQALHSILRHTPDIVVLDLALLEEDGLALTRRIRHLHPRLHVLVLSLHKESLFAEPALRAGAHGYLMKSEAPQHLIAALRSIADGNIYTSETVRQSIFQKMRTEALRQAAWRGAGAQPARRSARRTPRRPSRAGHASRRVVSASR